MLITGMLISVVAYSQNETRVCKKIDKQVKKINGIISDTTICNRIVIEEKQYGSVYFSMEFFETKANETILLKIDNINSESKEFGRMYINSNDLIYINRMVWDNEKNKTVEGFYLVDKELIRWVKSDGELMSKDSEEFQKMGSELSEIAKGIEKKFKNKPITNQ